MGLSSLCSCFGGSKSRSYDLKHENTSRNAQPLRARRTKEDDNNAPNPSNNNVPTTSSTANGNS